MSRSFPPFPFPPPPLPPSHFLPQVILLEETWCDLFLLCAIQWSQPLESSPLFSVADHTSGVPVGKVSAQAVADLRLLHGLMIKFRRLAADPAEFACLKAIALFRPGTSIFKERRNEIRSPNANGKIS